MRVISKSDLKIKTNNAAHIITKISDKLFVKLSWKKMITLIIEKDIEIIEEATFKYYHPQCYWPSVSRELGCAISVDDVVWEGDYIKLFFVQVGDLGK